MANISAATQRATHRFEETVSIVLSLGLAAAGGIFFFTYQDWTPASEKWLYVLAWLVLGYLAIQLTMLLSTSIDSHSIGFLDVITSLLPVLVGAVAGIEAIQGILKLSTFQQNCLLLMVSTGLLDALITLWVRFTVNRRTIGIDPSN